MKRIDADAIYDENVDVIVDREEIPFSREDYEKRLDELKVPKVQREKIETWLKESRELPEEPEDRPEPAAEQEPAAPWDAG